MLHVPNISKVSNLSTSSSKGSRKHTGHDQNMCASENKIDTAKMKLMNASIHQCTLQTLGPEDKQKVAKLLKQVTFKEESALYYLS
jgi:hypothetical protein